MPADPLRGGRPVPDLFPLLPSVHRIEDHGRGGPLEALMQVLSQQADLLRRDAEGLYDTLFIDTCPDWACSYIGQLVGTRPLHDVDQARRRDVARTIHYRRRKGILPMLEQLAGDVTGWHVHAVAEFERLAWSQHLEHVRSRGLPPAWSARLDHDTSLVGAAIVRDADTMDRVGRPRDRAMRTIDVRHRVRDRPRSHPRNVTFHAMPHESLETQWQFVRRVSVPATPPDSTHPYHGRTFCIGLLESDLPLFGREAPLRALELHTALEGARRAYLEGGDGETTPDGLYDPEGMLQFWRGDDPVPAREVHVMGLAKWGVVDGQDAGGNPAKVSAVPDAFRYIDHAGQPLPVAPGRSPVIPIEVVVDVATGRVIQRNGKQRMRVTYRRGWPALLGGGPYRREGALPLDAPWTRTVPGPEGNLGATLNKWELSGARTALIELTTDHSPRTSLTSITLPEDGELVLRGGAMRWPHLRGPVYVRVKGNGAARLTLDGICVQGQVYVEDEVTLTVRHSTLLPGRTQKRDGTPAHPKEPCIIPAAGKKMELHLRLDHSVTGPLRLDPDTCTVQAQDSILQAPDVGGAPGVAYAGTIDPSAPMAPPTPGPPLDLSRCTVFGHAHPRTLDASETIFTDTLHVERRQEGCLRFSHVPHGSRAPRGFHCQPADAEAALGTATEAERAILRTRIAPTFVSRRYGHPDYARLRPDAHPAVREGAEDGGAMGAHHMLFDPLREQNLDARMEEYLPLGRRHTLTHHEAIP